MTKSYPTRLVKRILRRLGFKELSRGRGGHSIFVTPDGKKVCPPLGKKEVPFAYIFTLARILERLGVVTSKREFIASVKDSMGRDLFLN